MNNLVQPRICLQRSRVQIGGSLSEMDSLESCKGNSIPAIVTSPLPTPNLTHTCCLIFWLQLPSNHKILAPTLCTLSPSTLSLCCSTPSSFFSGLAPQKTPSPSGNSRTVLHGWGQDEGNPNPF